MSDSAAMDRSAIDAFLHRHGTGVLALADGDEAYAIPISYAYDAESPAVLVRLGFLDGSEKRHFLKASERVSVVVYDHVEGRWHSVVARGQLERVEADDVDSGLIDALRTGELPLVTVYGDRADDVEFELYRVAIDELTGRVEHAAGGS